MSPGLLGGAGAKMESEIMDQVRLFTCFFVPAVYCACTRDPHLVGSPLPPLLGLLLLPRLPGVNPLFPHSWDNPHKAWRGQRLRTHGRPRGWGPGLGHVLRAFLDEGGQVSTEEDPLQVTSETESQSHSGHVATSS